MEVKKDKTKVSLAEAFPEIAAEWHPTKNDSLTPEMVTPGSRKKVWWKCNKGHEWQTTVNNRTNGRGCPYCSGRNAIKGENDLKTINPSLASEWNYKKNKSTPSDVLPNSNKKVWWLGKCGHEWEAAIHSRTNGKGCPYCAGKKVWVGFNDLKTTHPNIAKEWHTTMNNDLTPEMVSAGSAKKVWWKCEHGHEWPATIYSRINGNGCPHCSRKLVISGKTDLATTHPVLATQWHPDKNGDLTPQMIAAGSNKKVWWQCSKGHEWQTTVNSRASMGRGCPYCSGRKTWIGFNDLATTHPEIASEWHPTQNGKLTPQKVSKGYAKKVWWKCKHGHEWQATVNSRTTMGVGCPYCSNNGTSRPELTLLYYIRKYISSDAIHRYRELGFELDVYISKRKIAIEYDGVRFHKSTKKDIIKNKKCLEQGIKLYRVRETGLSELKDSSVDYFYKYGDDKAFSTVISKLLSDISGNEININVTEDFAKINDFIKHTEIEESLAKYNPELAAEWHPTENGSLTPEMVTPSSNLKVWWQCKYGHKWQAAISVRTNGNGCPYCAGKKVWVGFNDLATTHPMLAAEWHPDKNEDLTPQMVSAGSGKKVWWICKHRHEWEATIYNRTKGNGCPYCSGRRPIPGETDLTTIYPIIAKEWHPTKNGDLTPDKITSNSGKKIWWQCEHSHEWKARVVDRAKGYGCPYCAGRHPVPGVTDLTTTHPAITTQWHPDKNGTLSPEMLSAGSNKDVWWQCTHCGHEYQRPVYKQTRKDHNPRCPHCKTPVNSSSDSDKIPS